MKQDLLEQKQRIVRSLDALSAATGDFFALYDYRTRQVHVCENAVQSDDIFYLSSSLLTVDQWRHCADLRDRSRVEKVTRQLLRGHLSDYNVNYRIRSKTGRVHWINSRGKVFRSEDGTPEYLLFRLCVSENADRTVFFRGTELRREVRALLRASQNGYLLLLGVDNLKSINMQNGRDFGDALLEDLVRILRDEVHDRQTVYRISGDWFALNLPQASPEEVSALFSRVQTRLSGQCTVSGGSVSFTDYHVSDENVLIQYAEVALDEAKTHGKGILCFFSAENYEQRLRQLELREDLQAAVHGGFCGFSLEFQPQVRTASRELYGAEALLRFQSPRRGKVSPEEFIPLLEQSDLIGPVGLWTLREALRACREWRTRLPRFCISVNMSYRQLSQGSVEDDVLAILQESGLPGAALTIEVTESMELLDYPHLNEIFLRWKQAGIEISVDDFGTGYSSLGRLKEMAVDEIKIDRCFVWEIGKSTYNYRLLRNIMELADSCGIRVCCEGVETREELAVLEELNPTLMQGFLFARPCSREDFARYLETPHPFDAIPRTCPPVRTQEPPADSAIAQTILNAENDIFYLADLDTHELYYLNPAGQKMFGVTDYLGRTCYKVLHGRSSPCDFCTNALLRQDSFYVWENHNQYCGRHFLLKDKLVTYRGRPVRLEVALDITRQEYVSESARERLSFAGKIAGYMETLSSRTEFPSAVQQVLASVGDFYQADRAYLFERSPEQPALWSNTFEWCAPHASPQRENLQNVPARVTARWDASFSLGRSVIILNIDPLEHSHPEEWAVLRAQNIQRIIAVPLRDGGNTIGFIGVDNPRYCIHDDTQVRVLASFLLARIRQDRNEHRYQQLLAATNQDILQDLQVGFWTITIWKATDCREMTMDPTGERLLGMQGLVNPVDRYRFWSARITAGSRGDVRRAAERMTQCGKTVPVEFVWDHPDRGLVRLRFSGLPMETTRDVVRLKGFCRCLPESGTPTA